MTRFFRGFAKVSTLLGEHNHHGADIPWFESRDEPGVKKIGYLRQLMESVAFLSRIPDQTIITGKSGREVDHAQATREAGGRYALVYLPTGRTVEIHMQTISGPRAKTMWLNPRDGSKHPAGTVDTRGTRQFEPLTRGKGQDWVLVILSETS